MLYYHKAAVHVEQYDVKVNHSFDFVFLSKQYTKQQF